MEHQDWNSVIIHGKGTLGKRTTVNVPHREVTKEQKLDSTELGTHEKVSISLAKTIQQARIGKGFKTQKEKEDGMVRATGVQRWILQGIILVLPITPMFD